jgi:hypothetical protein
MEALLSCGVVAASYAGDTAVISDELINFQFKQWREEMPKKKLHKCDL